MIDTLITSAGTVWKRSTRKERAKGGTGAVRWLAGIDAQGMPPACAATRYTVLVSRPVLLPMPTWAETMGTS